MSFLKNITSSIKDEFLELAEDGLDADVTKFIDTGCYSFNALVSGSLTKGIPGNKILGLAGDPSTGKTMFALNFVRSFLNEHPDGVCIYFDTESAITTEMLITRGINPKQVAIVGSSVVEEFRNQAVKILDKYVELPQNERKPMILVLDSLGMLSTRKEVGDITEGKDTRDMTRAQVIKAAFRVLTLKLGKAGVPMIVTNHTYNVVGAYVPTKAQGGGTGLPYAASTIVFLSKRKDKDEDKDVIGNIITCKLEKGRFTKENKDVEVLLNYNTGLDKYYGLLPIAEKYEIFKKVSTKYELPDGTKVFEKQLKENPEKYYTPEVLKLIEKAVEKEFKYGNTINLISQEKGAE